MKHYFLLLAVLFLTTPLLANDGAFFVKGNQLIPMGETDISVQKEILTIKRVSERAVEVNVYYEFYNPKEAKKMIVGFEAASPSGGADTSPTDRGTHPYMRKFTVNMNGSQIPHKVAMVSDNSYYKYGKIEGLALNEAREMAFDGSADFYYVYHFNANFKKGVNIVKHTYTFDMGGSIYYNFYFDYILSAAMRWGNKQIDDFTLIIDMGEHTDFCVGDAAFGKNPLWELQGVGKAFKNEQIQYVGTSKLLTCNHFYIRKGQIMFKAKNFKSQDELFIFSAREIMKQEKDFDYRDDIALPPNCSTYYDGAVDNISKRILRNLPFAWRGYIFSTPQIQEYYSKQRWYMPDPTYKSTLESLTKEEQDWVKIWSN